MTKISIFSCNSDSPYLKHLILFTILTLAGLLITGCSNREDHLEIDLDDRVEGSEVRVNSASSDADVLRIGFDLRSNPQEDARQYLPFLEYLEKATGYTFELVFTPGNDRIVDDLGTGAVQFAFIGAGSYIQVHSKYGVVPLVHGLNAQGEARYQSVIIVPPDSPIRDIEDLRGRRFAFGSVTSTQGHLIPRIILAEHGLILDDLAAYEYTGSHQNCANAVSAGQFDAGGMQDILGMELAADGLVHIIYTSRHYPSSGIAANIDVPAEILEKVQQALLDFDPQGRDSSNLYHWNMTEMPNGFVKAEEDDYADLLEWALVLGFFSDEPRP
ncbi:MAG: phosphate/phosphite/phosphonate ABC transporter substrate-binding protein [Candidatus Aegiribacteria sp.]|nr:phosphate/phosphite/phosphonate ABC transporter substrate-binding protein [Candidatus Aegiribacteria sp.]